MISISIIIIISSSSSSSSSSKRSLRRDHARTPPLCPPDGERHRTLRGRGAFRRQSARLGRRTAARGKHYKANNEDRRDMVIAALLSRKRSEHGITLHVAYCVTSTSRSQSLVPVWCGLNRWILADYACGSAMQKGSVNARAGGFPGN